MAQTRLQDQKEVWAKDWVRVEMASTVARCTSNIQHPINKLMDISIKFDEYSNILVCEVLAMMSRMSMTT